MRLFVIDTETSGLDPSTGGTIVELAWIELTLTEPRTWKPTSYSRQYVEFNGHMDPHAQASHHIRSDQLMKANGAVPRDQAVHWMTKQFDTESVCVAHNVAFDSKFLPEVTLPWICTYKCSKHIWPEAPGHSNQVLRYWLELGIHPDVMQMAPILGHMHPHQALFDVAITSGILLKMLEKYTTEQLIVLTHRPFTLKTINFGKHKGLDFSQVPRDYLQWLRGQSNLDDDLKHTLDVHLQK